METLPRSYLAHIQNLLGERGLAWLANLPFLRAALLERWSLQPEGPVRPLSYNYLEFARTADGTPVVLKIGIPDPELETEILALKTFNGLGAVRLIEADLQSGALLLERVLPGNSLASLNDDEDAAHIAGRVMQSLWKPDPGAAAFPTAEDWCRGFNRYRKTYPDKSGPLPSRQVDSAASLARELLQSPAERYLLHGDLHHSNILSRQDGSWIAIDPKGVIGEPAFEGGPFLANPLPDFPHNPDLDDLLERRLAVLAEETKQDRKLLASWSYCRAVLSAIWSLEESQSNFGDWIHLADHLQAFL